MTTIRTLRRPNSPLEIYRRLMKRFGRTKTAMVLFRRTAPVADRFVSKISGGRHTAVGIVVPTLILTHIGRKSGRRYDSPLMYLPLDGNFVVAGSNWGRAEHPGWSDNLLAHPDATVVVGGETLAVRARLASAQERRHLWAQLAENWPPFTTYAKRAGDREIRVFVLEPLRL